MLKLDGGWCRNNKRLLEFKVQDFQNQLLVILRNTYFCLGHVESYTINTVVEKVKS